MAHVQIKEPVTAQAVLVCVMQDLKETIAKVHMDYINMYSFYNYDYSEILIK